jgi:hypothetical protein
MGVPTTPNQKENPGATNTGVFNIYTPSQHVEHDISPLN